MDTQTKKYIAFFDLDRTILTSNSGAVLVRQAYKEGLLSNRSLISAIYQSYLYKFNMRNTEQIISKMGSWVKGFPVDSLMNFTNSIVTNLLLDAIREEIYIEISFHKEHDAEVVMLSSAISLICIPISEHLGMDNVICTEMEVINGVFTGNPSGNYCFSEEKVIRLTDYCRKNNIDLKDTWYYGDSISDLPVLNFVGTPICVNPDKKLKKVALERNWETLLLH
jgi:HAD superfamily hydrolase (TIGR01490 family)